MKKKVISIIGVLLVAFLFIIGQSEGQTISVFSSPFSNFSNSNLESKQEPGIPKRLHIPALGIDAPVRGVGLNSKGEMGIFDEADVVAWYRNGPRPGEMGSAVVNGHFDTKEVQYGVFHDLDRLVLGDVIEVIDEHGETFRFRVIEKKIYHYTDPAPEVFSSTSSTSLLNLITCLGTWLPEEEMYDQRLVVFTERIE